MKSVSQGTARQSDAVAKTPPNAVISVVCVCVCVCVCERERERERERKRERETERERKTVCAFVNLCKDFIIV